MTKTGRRNPLRRVAAVLSSTLFVTSVAWAVGAAVPPPSLAALPGAAGLIAFDVDNGGSSQIWTIQPDGTGIKQLTTTGNNYQPTWSPDGSKILFVSDRDGNLELYLMDPDGGHQTRVTNDPEEEVMPAWSPDGTKLAWSRYANGNYDVWVSNPDGSDQVDLTNNGANDDQPSWRPGTNTIAFETNRTGDWEIYAINADGTGLTNLTKNAGSHQTAPDWSPDGTKIAYRDSTANGIRVMNADGSGATTISHQVDDAPVWSPDGAHIAFLSNRDQLRDIYVMDANGANAHRLTSNAGIVDDFPNDNDPSWQPLPALITPAARSFGNVKIGSPSAGAVITLQTGLLPATVTGVAISGPNAADFDLLGQTCTAATVPIHGSCTATVRFDPLTVGLKSATLVFTISGVGTRAVALAGTGRTFLWGAIHSAGPAYTWNYGDGLARTAAGSTTYLHAIYVTDRINGAWADDTTHKVGAYYIRSTNGGATWTAPKRLNPTTQQGSRVAIAASNPYVYAVWVSQTKWIAYSGTAPRVLYFRRNTNHGSSTAWGTTIRLTSTTGRVDYAQISATGTYVYVSYTDSSTGAVKLAISADRGAHWKTVTVGTTTRTSSSGRLGYPTVAAAGKNVGVAWVSDPAATVKARISTTNGSTWATTVTLGTTTSTPSATAAGTRMGFAWTHGSATFRIWDNGTWQPTRTMPPTEGYASEHQIEPALGLLGTTQVAVVYTACTIDCTFSDAGKIATGDLILRISTNGGVAWNPSDPVGTNVSTRRMNDTPTILWPAPAKPYVLWNGWNEGSTSYRLYFRQAT